MPLSTILWPMPQGETYNARTLGPREAEVVAWLEAERPPGIDVDSLADVFDWTRPQIRDILRRLARKGWMQRTAKGRYEPLLADTGGWALPNAWAALSSWGVPYYVGFASAAHERHLTPDRPGSVQTCVAVGAKRPRAWAEIPISLVHLRSFVLDGTEQTQLHGFPVQLAKTEKVLVDGAATPARVGGAIGLARILNRSFDEADWERFVHLASGMTRGGAASRRLAAIADLIGHEVPDKLATFASERVPESKDSVIYLDDRSLHGRRGQRLKRWQVVVNVSPEALREEVRR